MRSEKLLKPLTYAHKYNKQQFTVEKNKQIKEQIYVLMSA